MIAMENLLPLALYFGLGVGSDILVTFYYSAVSRGWAASASLVSLLISLLNFWVLGHVLVLEPSWQRAIAYALGNALGCFLIMRYMRGREKNERNRV